LNIDRLVKNAHLRRCPARSPSRGRGKESLLIRRDATLRIACLTGRERPLASPRRKRDFVKLNLHLPACRSLGSGRGIFDQLAEE
jgi:hypothetical protein